MGISANFLSTNVLLLVLLLYFCYVSGEYSAEWVGEGNDIVVVPRHAIRKDKGILYGVIRMGSSNAQSVLELHFETPQLQKQNFVVLPTRNLQKFTLFSLGRNNALFIYKYQKNNSTISKFRGVVVDVMRDKKYDIEIPSDFPSINLLNLIIYTDKFDFVTNHSSICKESKVCRISFDQKGKKIGEPVAFSDGENWEMFSITPAQPNSLTSGIFVRYLDPNSRRWRVSYRDESAKEKSSFEEPEGARYPASNTYNLFSICGIEAKSWAPLNKAVCTQYDLKTGKITNSSTPVDKNVVDVAVANLHTGGYVFSTTNCDDSLKCDSFDVNVVAFNGKSVKKGPFPLDLNCGEFTGLVPNSAIAEIGDDMCFLFSCGNKINQSKFKIYNRCLPKNGFTV